MNSPCPVRSATRISLLATVLLAAAACGSDSVGPNTSAQPECTGPVTVTVSGTTTPSFSWAPACRLFFVNVEPTGAGSDQWNVVSDSANAISAPVQYGVVPAGARQLTPSVTPLVSGTSYTVYVFRWTGPGKQDGVMIGSAAFVP